MSSNSVGAAAARGDAHTGPSAVHGHLAGLHDYFAADGIRTAQTLLGLLWLLDGGLQLQSFMYSHAFARTLYEGAAGQPGWLHDSIAWGVRVANADLGFYNTCFALIQVVIGLGLLHRRTVRPALALSFAWAIFVWWFGEAFGMLFMNMAQPLSGAPGAVIVYLLVGLIVWPNDRPGGLIGIRGTRTLWVALWLLLAFLWLLESSSGANAIHDMIEQMPSGVGLVTRIQHSAAGIARGNGLTLALVFAALSAIIGIGVGTGRWLKDLLVLSAILDAIFWVVGQGLGGVFNGGATDPGTAPLLALLAYAVWQVLAPRSADPIVAEQPSGMLAAQRSPAR